ncbi:zeta toxin family protein [Enterococcus plantarum]|uniref:zeta toxin family protein n=1 Tax=Enterococcus plantarum TaxID=1077675 RepID=UPI001A8CEF02|nr:zeta toxin family protein [Enterococcus plantarum]MBO0468000.1 zeta toxin family protein [Enterococcus plantarum]
MSNFYIDYTEQQYSLILEDTLEALTLSKVPAESPKAFLLGGQPGAGKTALRYAIMKEIGTNVIVVDNDSFKQAHPNFDEIVEQYGKDYVTQVTPFSNRLTEDIVEYLSDKNYHLIVEGTLRTVEVPTRTASLLEAKGYEMSLYVVAVSKDLSYLGTLARYEYQFSKDAITARETKKEHHDLVVQNLSENVSTLYKENVFKTIKIFDREMNLLYDFGQTPLKNPKDVLEPILSGKVKANSLLSQIQKTMQLMEINGHQKSENYKELITKYKSLKKLF